MNPVSLGLTQDVLFEIFFHLPIESTRSIARVCKLWKRVANDERIWKHHFASYVSQEFASKPCPSLSYQEACKQIVEIKQEYPRPLIEAFEGLENILTFPIFVSREPKEILRKGSTVAEGKLEEDCIQFRLDEVTARMMRGKTKQGEHFFVFNCEGNTSKKKMTGCFFQTSPHSKKWAYEMLTYNPASASVKCPLEESDIKQIKLLQKRTHSIFQLIN